MRSLQPLADNIVVKPLKTGSKTASGIVLPDSAKEKSKQAEVVAVGKEAKEVSPGDVIIYKDFAGNEIKIDGQEYLVVSIADVLAVVVESSSLKNK